MKKFGFAVATMATIFGSSLVLVACDDSSSTSSEVDLRQVSLEDLLDSVVCNNEGKVSSVKSSDTTMTILCGEDSVGYGSTLLYEKCNVNFRDNDSGLDFICDNKIIGVVNFKQESSSSSEKVESSSSEETESSSSEKTDNDEKSSSSVGSESSSSSVGSESSSSTVAESSSSEEKPESSSSPACTLLELPEPIAYAQTYVDCSAEFYTMDGAEVWDVGVGPVSADTARMLWSIRRYGFTENSGFTKYTDGKYFASGSMITKDGFSYSVNMVLSVKDDNRYSGDLEFKRRSASCADVAKAFPNDFVCIKGVLTDVADAAYCGDDDPVVYNKNTHFCQDESSVYALCGGKPYEMDEFCFKDEVYSTNDAEKCGDALIKYDEKPQFCDNGVVVDYGMCGGSEFDPRNQFCDARDKQVYGFVKIGNLVWMSENLNYYDETNPNFVLTWTNGDVVDELTHCGGMNCNEYGRLYTWTAAMDINAYDYMTGRKVYADTVAHQGICPEGWHIPRMSEAEALIASVKSGKQLCKDYGASKYETCDNETGFSAIGAGVYKVGATAAEDSYKVVDESAAFWLANNKLAAGGATTGLASDFYIQMPWGVLQSEDDGNHMDGLSVRCVKD